MNERIREKISHYLCHERFSRYGESTEEEYYEFYPDELEELIKFVALECIDWCNAHATVEGTAQKIGESIKKDFGVEE